MKIIPYNTFVKAIFIVGIVWFVLCLFGVIAAILSPDRIIIY